METASFSTLSPNTSILRVGLTSRAWKMARVATGSTAEIRAPNVKLGTRRMEWEARSNEQSVEHRRGDI